MPIVPAIRSIAGVWHDSDYPANTTQISQQGNRFTLTRWGTLPNGIQFKATGSGTIFGRELKIQYTRIVV